MKNFKKLISILIIMSMIFSLTASFGKLILPTIFREGALMAVLKSNDVVTIDAPTFQ